MKRQLQKASCAMNSDPGTYALIFRSPTKATTLVGRWGEITLERGYYIYVGGALGPGGVRARVLRHCREEKPNHWHIDYLRRFLSPVCAWYIHDRARLEHKWARVFSKMRGISAIQGFGCSDCRCDSHLFHSATKPSRGVFADLCGSEIGSWVAPRTR